MRKKTTKPIERPFWLVLDVHGVLIPSSEKWILSQLARQTHQPVFLLYLRWLIQLPSAQRGKRSAKSFYEEVLDRPLTQKEFNDWVMKRYAHRGTISPAIVAQLKHLKKGGWKLAILSDMNTAQAAFHRKMGHFSFFDEVFLSCETGLMKPFPSAYVALEKKLHTRKDHIVFVDDLWFNTWGAALHGWRSVTLKGEKQLHRFLLDLE
jgi:HAD superfamily hydrolase (TIGR01509 family)